MPKISIIIATNSRPDLLSRAVMSAFEAGTDVEVIVVDDASTDETAKVCQQLHGIKYIRTDVNQHTAGARNLGILASTAQYIGFLDDDDWRLPDSLNKQIQLLDQNPNCGLVYGQFLQANASGEILPDAPLPENCLEGDLFWPLMEYNFIGCLTAIFRKDCIYKVGLLDTKYSRVDDWDLWLRIALHYDIAAVDEPVAVWKKASTASNQGSSNMTQLFRIAIAARKKKWSGFSKFVGESIKKRKENHEKFERNLTYMILNDFYNSCGFWESSKKLLFLLISFPKNLVRLDTYKALLKKLI